MVSKVFVTELVDHAPVQTFFLVAQKAIRETKNGAPYLNVTLQDRTGAIEGRAWDNALAMDGRFDQGDFVVVRGKVSSYRDQLQLNVTDIERIEEDSIDLGDFLPESRWSGEELYKQLVDLLNVGLRSAEMRRFFDVLFADESRRKAYSRAPAAVTNHHNFIGGLLEHTLSMARIARMLTTHYERYYPGMINRDLVLGGVILHDMGKIDELSYRKGFEYTTQGRLVGHIVRGVEIINETAALANPPFSEEMLMQLKHMVLSHHGKLEYGSPTLPKTPEALLLHEIDMIDSRMNMCWNIVDKHLTRGNGAAPAEWTDYQRLFESSLYVGASTSDWWNDDQAVDPAALIGPGAMGPAAGLSIAESSGTPSPPKEEAPKSDLNLSLFND